MLRLVPETLRRRAVRQGLFPWVRVRDLYQGQVAARFGGYAANVAMVWLVLPGAGSLGFAILALLVGEPATVELSLDVNGLLRREAMERKTKNLHAV